MFGSLLTLLPREEIIDGIIRIINIEEIEAKDF